MKNKIKIKRYTWWKFAASRKSAVKIIEQEKINFDDSISFDFNWIEVASYCFVDELIWPYIGKLWKIPNNLKFKNANDYIKEQIEFVITERLKK